jgi:FkbM family methyltransferase
MRSLIQKSVSLVPWKLRNAIKTIPLIAPLQRRFLRSFLEGEEFVHTVDAGPARGLKYPITLPGDKGIWTGTYELPLAERIARAVRPGDVCLDIGGWHGFFSGVMALAGASKVLVFEPLPANVTQIRKLIDLNPQLPIEIKETAIGEAVGTTEFRIMADSSMAKMAKSSFQNEQQGGECIRVPVETLDHLKAGGLFPRADVVKLDVEGAEAMALSAATNVLRDDRPQIFIEIHSRGLARECFELLSSFGYKTIVAETGATPDYQREPEVCHFVAVCS